jgi:hypothetical protein
MPDTNRGEWIALLKRQVNAAEEREDRWRRLCQELTVTNRDTCETIAKLRRSEVHHLKILLQQAQGREQ